MFRDRRWRSSHLSHSHDPDLHFQSTHTKEMTTKMKIIALLSFPAAICASISPRTRSATFLSDSALLVRGGDLGPISGEALAKTFGVLAIGDAIGGSVSSTAEVYEKFHITVVPGSNGEHYLGHGIASSASQLAVTSLLALTGTTSVEEAVGFGMLARSAYMTEMLLTGKYKDLGVPTVPHLLVYMLLLGTAFGLLSGSSDGVTLAKIVSVILAGHGSLLFLNPRIDGELLCIRIMPWPCFRYVSHTLALLLLQRMTTRSRWPKSMEPTCSLAHYSPLYWLLEWILSKQWATLLLDVFLCL